MAQSNPFKAGHLHVTVLMQQMSQVFEAWSLDFIS